MDVDENGWATGLVAPLADARWVVLSPEGDARVDALGWGHKAARFFGFDVEMTPAKRYPSGAHPLVDQLRIQVTRRARSEERGVVDVVTFPASRAPGLVRLGLAAAEATRAGGMDALVKKAKRVWQIGAAQGDARAELAVAALLATALLGPVVDAGGTVIFGVKGARERLGRLGWS